MVNGIRLVVIKTKRDQYVDEVFRKSYGQGYTWDSANNTLARRMGVGKIESGPSNPGVSIPNGKVAQRIHELAEIPVAISPSSVARADLGFDDKGLDNAKPESATWKRAQTKARAYMSGK